MDMSGTRTIAADRATVWAYLNDPDTLLACIPGCTELTGTAEDGFEAVVKQKVGPVTATFRGKVVLSQVQAPHSYTISGEGTGGVAGFASGSADLVLLEVLGGTELSYIVNARIGGKIAQLGSRIVDGFARKMANQFFERFADHVELVR